MSEYNIVIKTVFIFLLYQTREATSKYYIDNSSIVNLHKVEQTQQKGFLRKIYIHQEMFSFKRELIINHLVSANDDEFCMSKLIPFALFLCK